MKNHSIYLIVLLSLVLTSARAQDSFEEKVMAISVKIKSITKEEKENLRIEVDAVNQQVASGAITQEQGDEKKEKLSEARAKIIETKVELLQAELQNLVQKKVDSEINEEKDSTKGYSLTFPSMKIKKKYGDKHNGHNREARTTTQLVFALGLNNAVTHGQVAHSDYRYWGSHFYEVGLTANTRILKNNNLLHAKYGLSLIYNNLRPYNNKLFVQSGDQTNLETSDIHLDDSRFHNSYLVVPLHLEFDFSKNKSEDSKSSFRTHKGFRLGVGGFAGINLNSKQILEYDADGNDVCQESSGSFNVNDFIYGASAYIGYRATSIYVKYDISPIFSDNAIDQNNISLGLRFDFN